MLSCIIFGYVIGAIEGIVLNYTAMSTKHRNMIVTLNYFMKKYEIPFELKYKARRYLDFTWDMQQSFEIDESEILKLFSHELQEMVCVYSRGHIFNNFFIFNRFDQKFLKKLTLIINYSCFGPRDIIFEEGEKSKDIYFIQDGEVILEDIETECALKKLEHFDYFGDIAFFLGSPRSCSARALTFLETLTIPFAEFFELLSKDPDAKEYVIKLQSSSTKEAYIEMGIECYFCKGIGHITKTCGMLNHGKQELLNQWIEDMKNGKKIKPTTEGKQRNICPQFLKYHPRQKQFYDSETFFTRRDSLKKSTIKEFHARSVCSDSSDSGSDSASATSDRIRSFKFDDSLVKRKTLILDP